MQSTVCPLCQRSACGGCPRGTRLPWLHRPCTVWQVPAPSLQPQQAGSAHQHSGSHLQPWQLAARSALLHHWQPPSLWQLAARSFMLHIQFWAQFGCAGTGYDMHTRWTRVLARQRYGWRQDLTCGEKHWTLRQKHLCRKACHHLLPLPLSF